MNPDRKLDQELERLANMLKPPGSVLDQVMNTIDAEPLSTDTTPSTRLVPDVQTEGDKAVSCQLSALSQSKAGERDAAARATAANSQPPRRRHTPRRYITMFQKRTVRWSVAVSAAALLSVVGISWISLTPRQLTAAELLQTVIEVNKAYQGWVHFSRHDGFETHVNTINGTMVYVSPNGIHMESPRTRQIVEYDRASNVIQIEDQPNRSAGATAARASKIPVNLTALLSEFTRQTGLAPQELKRSVENQQERIDIAFFKSSDDARAVMLANGSIGRLPLRGSVWVDAQTRLIQRMESESLDRRQDGIHPSGPFTFTITYGQPAMTDIYAAGAPRDATVVDRRPEQGLQAVLDRLANRAAGGFGDGVAILTSSEVQPNDSLDPDVGVLQLFLVEGQAQFYGEYLIRSDPGPTGQTRGGTKLIATPEGWPTPTPETVLPGLSPQFAEFLSATDGQCFWIGQGSKWPLQTRQLAGALRNAYAPSSLLYRQIWPDSTTFGRLGITNHGEILSDPGRPQQIGVRVQRFADANKDLTRRLLKERVHWLDPSRDDMPMESVEREYGQDRQVTRESQWHYLEYAQLPDGSWYPTRWRTLRSESGAANTLREFHLRFYPGMEADRAWFTPDADQPLGDTAAN